MSTEPPLNFNSGWDNPATALLNAKPTAEQKLGFLRTLPHSELVALPAVDSIELTGYDRVVTLTTYRDLLQGNEVRIVVQLLVPGVLGSVRIFAAGFRAAVDENRVELTSEELYDFK